MDTTDISAFPQYVKFLAEKKQSLQYAQSRKGERPKERKTRAETIMQFMLPLMMKHDHSSGWQTSFLPPAYPPCLSSFRDLTQVMIKDLLLETHHRGKYLLLRSVTPPDRFTAVSAVVEDETKDVITLHLYYQEKNNEYAADEILPEGTILIVKEPYFKVMANKDYGIRVDHLSDVVYLPIFDERVPMCWQPRLVELNVPAKSWKMKGNEYYKQSKYYAAIDW